jgi:hypothetical protein
MALQSCYDSSFIRYELVQLILYCMKLNNFFVILVLEISIFICNNNVTYLTKYCNLPAVTLQRKQVKTNQNENSIKKFNSCISLC